MYATMNTPMAGRTRATASAVVTPANPISGGLESIAPTVGIASPRELSTDAATAASATTMSGIGTRGNLGVRMMRSPATATPMTTEGHDRPDSCTLDQKDLTSVMKESPATSNPLTLPIWLVIMMTATPAMYPTSTGLESRSPMNPSLSSHATMAHAPQRRARSAARDA